MNKNNIRYSGLPKGGGLKNIQKYKELSDDEDSNYSSDSDYSSDESETKIAHRQLEARFWKDEGKEAYNFFLSTLNNKQEILIRANEENKDIMGLIKSFIK